MSNGYWRQTANEWTSWWCTACTYVKVVSALLEALLWVCKSVEYEILSVLSYPRFILSVFSLYR